MSLIAIDLNKKIIHSLQRTPESQKTQQGRYMKIGILGGGQLARMLLQKGIENGHEMHVLCQNNEPATFVTAFHHPGSPHSELDLISFFQKVDVITFESEFISIPILKTALEKTAVLLQTSQTKKTKVPEFFPPLKSMEVLQDRLTQKQLLNKFKIPTLPFYNFENPDSGQTLWSSSIIKRRRGGYDGYGTYSIRGIIPSNILKILKTNTEGHIVEPRIQFERELALIFSRNRLGKIEIFPLVESFQEHSKCLWVKGPIELKSKQEQDLKKIIKKISGMLHSLPYVGVIAFELFQISKDEQKRLQLRSSLIVNEIAPRVHNSGHFSLNAMDKDQFTSHLHAITQRNSASPELYVKNFVMLNLIGAFTGPAKFPNGQNGSLHWYGKKDSKIGRKLGHINYQSHYKTQNELLKIALKELKKWRKNTL